MIYKGYSQEQLDLQYNNRHHVPEYETYLAKWETLSREAKKNHPVIHDIPYGNLHREFLDVFPAPNPGSKTLIFIHGGYWHMLDKSLFYFVGGVFANYGITTVLINYPLAPSASMDQIVASCRDALRFVQENLVHFNGDPKQVYVTGHSAGGHLAAMLIAAKGIQSDQTVIHGICAISGLFNLIPIQLSNVNNSLLMDKKMAIRNSPVQLTPAKKSTVILAVGTAETEEFKQQSLELFTTWRNKTSAVQLLTLPGLNHFSILDSLIDSDATLHKVVRNMMKV
jgi:arylformamidase